MRAAGQVENSTIQLNELAMVVSCGVSDQMGLRYYYALPYSVFFQDYNSHLKMLVTNFIVSILFTFGVLLVISYMSNLTYRKQLTTMSREAGLHLLDESKTFDQSLHTITNQLSTLNTVVEQTRPMLHRNYVRSLILGRSSAEAFEKLQPGLQYEGIFCMIAHLSLQDSAKLNLDLLHGELTRGGEGYSLLLATLEQNEIAVVVNTGREAVETVRTQLNQRLETAFANSYAADGQWFELSAAGFKAAFESAQTINRYHFIYPHRTRLHFDLIHPEQVKNSGSHLKLFGAIEKDILSENLLDLRHKLSALTESFKFGSYSIDYCSSTLRDLVTMLYNIMQSWQLDMWVAFGYDIRAHYKQIADIDEFYHWSCEVCEILMQNLRQRKCNVTPNLRDELVKLIDENLENNISLEFLADCLGLRSDVMSRTFKQLMGKSYIDYIKEKKLIRAKELIAEGHSMKEIAQRLGYNSTQYFIKIFKETNGITPYQYRKNGMTAE